MRAIELDVGFQPSVDRAVADIIAKHGRIDVIVHNAGHMAFGPAEAFTPEQFAELYDVNVLSTQRVNRAALPHMRKRGEGLLIWVSSSSSAGGTPPYLSPYFAAKAGMDALAVQYAPKLALGHRNLDRGARRVPTTNHFAHSGSPACRSPRGAAGPMATREESAPPSASPRTPIPPPWRSPSPTRSTCPSASARSASIDHRGRRRGGVCGDRPRAQRDAEPRRPLGPAPSRALGRARSFLGHIVQGRFLKTSSNETNHV